MIRIDYDYDCMHAMIQYMYKITYLRWNGVHSRHNRPSEVFVTVLSGCLVR